MDLLSQEAKSNEALRHGVHRCKTPEQTLELIAPLQRRAGITRVANLTGLDIVGVPVLAAYRPNSRSLSVSLGKGLTALEARVSAMMEALECFHAEHLDHPLRYVSFDEMRRRAPVCQVDRLARPSTSAFHPGTPILWLEGIDILNQRSVWVPYESVHLDLRVPLPTGSGAFVLGSNGLASGNANAEAILHGLCEVIERDAIALWSVCSYAKKKECQVDLRGTMPSRVQALINRIAQAKLCLEVWDTTSDLGVPTFLAKVSSGIDAELGAVADVTGSGTHPDPEVALVRAISEALQGRLVRISGARDDLDAVGYRQAKARATSADRHDSTVQPTHRVSFFESRRETCAADISDIGEHLRRAGLNEVVVVKIAPVELPISIVRVIVPGLESMPDAAGYLPGARARRVLRGQP